MTNPVVFCVLRTSPVYTAARVEWLRAQIRDAHLVCIGDHKEATFPLRFNWPGWWSKLELMRPDIPGDIFYLDLDTAPRGPLKPFFNTTRTTMLSDFYRPAMVQSSVMYLTEADRAKVWDAWHREGPGKIIARFARLRAGFNGDQNFIQEVLGAENIARWQDRPDTPVASYKVDVLRSLVPPRPDAMIVFHGKPRPWDVGY